MCFLELKPFTCALGKNWESHTPLHFHPQSPSPKHATPVPSKLFFLLKTERIGEEELPPVLGLILLEVCNLGYILLALLLKKAQNLYYFFSLDSQQPKHRNRHLFWLIVVFLRCNISSLQVLWVLENIFHSKNSLALPQTPCFLREKSNKATIQQ